MKEEVNKCIEVLKAGGIVLYPTDTIWGLGCDATNKEAVQKIYDLKKRDNSKSLIVLVANDRMMNNHVKDIPELAWDIMDLAQKPTTIIYDNALNLADNVTAEDNSVAVRMVKEGFIQHLIYKFGKPLVSTSANISNASSPSSFSEISNDIKNHVDFAVSIEFDKGNKKPSAIIKLGINGDVEVLRK